MWYSKSVILKSCILSLWDGAVHPKSLKVYYIKLMIAIFKLLQHISCPSVLPKYFLSWPSEALNCFHYKNQNQSPAIACVVSISSDCYSYRRNDIDTADLVTFLIESGSQNYLFIFQQKVRKLISMTVLLAGFLKKICLIHEDWWNPGVSLASLTICVNISFSSNNLFIMHT